MVASTCYQEYNRTFNHCNHFIRKESYDKQSIIESLNSDIVGHILFSYNLIAAWSKPYKMGETASESGFPSFMATETPGRTRKFSVQNYCEQDMS